MIAATYTEGRGFAVEETPPPRIGEDELLLRVRAAAICGTDLRIIRNGHRKLAAGQKIVLGHEFAGVVVEVGAKAGAFQVGQRLGVAPNMGCGRCDSCIRGLTNLCPDYTAFGITMDGAHTEYVRIPHAAIAQGNVVTLPEKISFAEAALAEPLSCVLSGMRAARVEPGDTVLVFGAGPIGLLHLMLAQVFGAARVLVADVRANRLAQAAELGASATINSAQEDVRRRVLDETAGRGADVVITACSVPAVQEQALELLAPLGRACFFAGLPNSGTRVRLDSNLIHYKQLLVTGTTGGSPRDFRMTLNLIAAGRLDVRRVVSHTLPLAEVGRAYHTALHEETLKIILSAEECGP
jgi:threonine dehydrogenase-like Zn-dependent dehydrogenase